MNAQSAEEEAKIDVYTEVMNAAIEAGDMNILPELWNLTLVSDARGDGAIFRERITNKIPEIANRYRMRPVTPFPKFANIWRAEALASKYMNSGGVIRAIKELIPKGAEEQVIHLSKLRPDMPWDDFARIAVEHNQAGIARFFFNKFQRENKSGELTVKWQAQELFDLALEKGNSDLVIYFFYFVKSNNEKVMEALRLAHTKNDAYLLRSILRELSAWREGELAAKFYHTGETDLAEKLIANGAPKIDFIRAIIAANDSELIDKYYNEFSEEQKEQLQLRKLRSRLW